MLVLVTFIGWIVVRYAGTYLDGENRQGPAPTQPAEKDRDGHEHRGQGSRADDVQGDLATNASTLVTKESKAQ